MKEDESMGLVHYVYPPVFKTDEVEQDIRYDMRIPLIYPQTAYYKGQLQHTEHGVIENGGIKFAEMLLKNLYNIEWFKKTIKASKIPIQDIIYRFSTSEPCRKMLLYDSPESEEDKKLQVHETVDQFLSHVRYGTGTMMLNYIYQHEIDQFQFELEKVILSTVEEYKKESTN